MTILKYKRHDTLPALRAVIKYSDTGEVVNFGTHATVFFHLRENQTNSLYLASMATILDSNGTVEYNWNSGDLRKSGIYWGEFEIEMSGGILTAPTENSLKIVVFDDFDNA